MKVPLQSAAAKVRPYTAQILVCDGPQSYLNWPSNITKGCELLEEFDQLASGNSKTHRIMACDLPQHFQPYKYHRKKTRPALDMIVWPDIRKLEAPKRVLVTSNSLKQPDLTRNREWNLPTAFDSIGVEQVELLPTKKVVMVCSHGERDERCGYCGPRLADEMQDYIQERGLQDEYWIVRSSHVGGHEFAGNVVFYPHGDWYGYVTPDAIPELFQHFERGEIYSDLLRGTMRPD